MAHEAFIGQVTFSDWVPAYGDKVPSVTIKNISNNKLNISVKNNGTENCYIVCTYAEQTLSAPITVDFQTYFFYAYHSGGKTQNFSITIDPSLTGVQINKSDTVLNYANNYQDVITATPLPIGTGAPVSYSWVSQDNNTVQCLNNTSNTVTLDGQHSNKNIIPVTVTASLIGGNLSFSATCNVLVKPNMRIFTDQFYDGQPYIYDNDSFNEAAEVYIYDGNKFNKDRVN